MAVSSTVETLDDLLRSAFSGLLDDGHAVVPTRGPTREQVGAFFELTNPRARLSRTEGRRRVVSAVAELAWYLRGANDADSIAFYISDYAREAEDDGTIYGAYGPRIFGEGVSAQFQTVLALLRTNPDTRRAVLQIFDRSDLSAPRRKDVPCTTSVQFLLRSDRLHAVVSMRSNDAYKGLPHDVFAFTMLQEVAARELGVEVGKYCHSVGSLHIYEDAMEEARSFLREGWQSTGDSMPPMPPGSQTASIEQLLATEQDIRSLIPYDKLTLPKSAYWADLARILARHVADKRLNDQETVERITSDFLYAPLARLL